MASVRKRGSAYQIAVSCGYDATGKQIRRTMTYKPDPNMTEKQVQKELRFVATEKVVILKPLKPSRFSD